MRPSVDVNMMVYDCVDTVGPVIESVLSQTWPSLSLTLLDNGSSDATPGVLQRYAERDPRVRVKRNRCNTGPVANIQRAFWFGDADFVLPKTSDDLIAPDYVSQLMEVLLTHPGCAMCHSGALVFSGSDHVKSAYPPEHWLEAVGDDPVTRACHVMQRYTSAPSFWGIYRRDAIDQLSTIRYRPGFDHAVVAELALYGEIRHVPELLYWRRGGGKPVRLIGRGATEQGNRGVPLDDVLSDQRWRTPLIATAHTHIEVFAVARLTLPQRVRLVRAVPEIFRARWLPWMRQELAEFRAALPRLLEAIATAEPAEAAWLKRSVTDALLGVQAIMPEADVESDLISVAAIGSRQASSGATAT